MFGGAKPWSERNIADKPCRSCSLIFSPSCGGNIYCKECSKEIKRKRHAESQKAWRSKDPARHIKIKLAFDLKKYGITSEEYSLMLERQSGVCAICFTIPSGGRNKHRPLSVDHCHKTGRVRGLLCHACNSSIGLLKENIDTLKSAVKYLEKKHE